MVNDDRVALVTGSASGIGFATLQRAVQLGYIAVGFDMAYGSRPEEATSPEERRLIDVDMRDALAVEAAVGDIERDVGPIAVVVAAAGALEERPLEAIDEQLWNDTLGLHLGGLRNVVVAAVPHMRRRHDGSIVAISSELAFLGAEDHVHYVAAKAAAVGFVRAAARELADANVRINCVAPGPTDTPLLGPSGRDSDYVASIPLRRLGRPEEVAVTIMDVARWPWTTGQRYAVNGGAVIR